MISVIKDYINHIYKFKDTDNWKLKTLSYMETLNAEMNIAKKSQLMWLCKKPTAWLKEGVKKTYEQYKDANEFEKRVLLDVRKYLKKALKIKNG